MILRPLFLLQANMGETTNLQKTMIHELQLLNFGLVALHK
jgi:hypothetical protein